MEDTVTTESTQPTNPRRWPWIVGIVAALLVGLLIGAAAADTEPATVDTPEPETITETETVEVEVTPQACADALDYAEETITKYEELIELKSELVELTAIVVTETLVGDESTFDDRLADYNVRQDDLIAEKNDVLEAFVVAGADCDPDWVLRTPAEEPAEEPDEEPDEVSGEYTAGAYVFDDVQVSRDFADDFEVRARVTNTGSSRELVLFKVTIFKDGTVVGTADGVVDGFDADSTVTITMFSLDSYDDGWDEIEFQVDAEM